MKQHARTDDDDGTTCRDEWIWGKKTINLKLKEEEEDDDDHHHQSIYIIKQQRATCMAGAVCIEAAGCCCWLLLMSRSDETMDFCRLGKETH